MLVRVLESIMRPNTLHYVLTLEHTITHGKHFYAKSTLRDTCYGIVHCSILNKTITNTEHPRTTQLLCRMLVWYIDEYERSLDTPDSESRHLPSEIPIYLYTAYICPGQAHCLNMRSNTDLIDLTMLGNLIDLSHCLDGRFYSQTVPGPEKAEMDHARKVFKRFRLLFCKHQHLLFGGDSHPVDPMANFFEPSIVHFASSLVKYKSMMTAYDDAFSLEDLESAVQRHFQAHYSDLLPSLLEKSKLDSLSCDPSLHWTGPDFFIGEGASRPLCDDTSEIGKFF
jgi:hypothetical protein